MADLEKITGSLAPQQYKAITGAINLGIKLQLEYPEIAQLYKDGESLTMITKDLVGIL
tara:strand:- start:362 stop:535 length:174 start_codon:yes stop_codon:yes gene_type:complete